MSEPIDTRAVHCSSCGVPFTDHLGLAGTCGTLQSLAKAVAAMRAAQRTYFQDRSKDILVRAKQLEKQVDRQLTEILQVDVESMS